MARGKAKGYFLQALREMRAAGYAVEARILDAQWLGVPQARERLIYVGVRDDLGRRPAFPTPLPWRYSVREAIPWIMKGREATEGHKFTILEVKRICSFPDDFDLLDLSYAEQWARLGNSVPPLMMRAIAQAVVDGCLA